MKVDFQLHPHFAEALAELNEKYGEKFAELNGFGNHQLNHTKFIDNFVQEDVVGDASIDANANVGTKDICSLLSEMSKPHTKLLAFNKLFYELEKEFGLPTAKKWLEAEWRGGLYMHDAYSSTFTPYCFAHDIERLVNEGLYFINNFSGGAPKHLTTYTDFIGEFVSWASARSSGAVGLPSFLVYSFYFWKKDVADGYAIKSPDYYARQEFQRIIYKLNQPYLRVKGRRPIFVRR